MNENEVKKMFNDVDIKYNRFGYSSRNGVIEYYQVDINEKGNKEKIDKLISLGWEKGRRRKQSAPMYTRCQYDGYSMILQMIYRVN